jgi:2-methylisocitrate lyase-like PEP mutase family enzyme
MSAVEQAAKAEAFRALHHAPPLLLMANAWDAITARLFEAEGFAAVATTSGGVSWAVGYADGEAAPWDEVVGQTARIARAVKVPVTADIEGGFGATPEAVARSIQDIVGAGAVGVNLEDGLPGPAPIRPLDDAVARIRAAREAANAAGVPIVINARTDLYLKQIGDEASRFDEAVARGKAYLAAGADCFYPITLRDAATIGRMVGWSDGRMVGWSDGRGLEGADQHQCSGRLAKRRGARSTRCCPRHHGDAADAGRAGGNSSSRARDQGERAV